MIWYTADLHLNHAAIIGYCKRPFRTARLMDDELVARLVAKVQPEDDLYVVGDFAFGHGPDVLPYVRSRFDAIPGRKHLIVGNHDKRWVREDLPWASVAPLAEVSDGGRRVVLCHYPMITWPGARYGAMQLFGHVHGNWLGSRNSVNVGVDVWDYGPVTLKDALQRAARLSVNRHWEDVEPRAKPDQLGLSPPMLGDAKARHSERWSNPMPDDDLLFSPAARAAEKARSREHDQWLMDTGQVSPTEMQRINGGGGLFRAKGRIVGYGVRRPKDE